MARNFDGTDDNVDFGSDASIDAFTAFTVLAWVDCQTPAANSDFWCTKNFTGGVNAGWNNSFNTFSNVCDFYRSWTTTDGTWTFPKPANGVHHMAITYDGAATTNNPAATVDGTSQTVTTAITPAGTLVSDAANPLRLGENANGGQDFQGKVGWFVYHDAILTAAEINRHRWWGRPFGGLKVYHPLITSKLANEGSATADGTATGSTMTSMVTPVQRPGSAMMGMGVGW